MAYEVVQEVTQPVHGADGSLVHRPGDRVGLDVELPPGAGRLTAAEVEDARAPRPRRASARHARDDAAQGDGGEGADA
jgi:hypothetical protein